MRAMSGDPGKLVQAGKACIDAEIFAKAFKERLSKDSGDALVGHASRYVGSMANASRAIGYDRSVSDLPGRSSQIRAQEQ